MLEFRGLHGYHPPSFVAGFDTKSITTDVSVFTALQINHNFPRSYFVSVGGSTAVRNPRFVHVEYGFVGGGGDGWVQ